MFCCSTRERRRKIGLRDESLKKIAKIENTYYVSGDSIEHIK